MAIPREAIPQLSDRFAALLPHLNERQRRLALGVEARLLGHGGVGTVARVAEVSETTVRRGIAELAADRGSLPDGRARAPGGGRRRAEDNNPAVLSAVVGRQNVARAGSAILRACLNCSGCCSRPSWPAFARARTSSSRTCCCAISSLS